MITRVLTFLFVATMAISCQNKTSEKEKSSEGDASKPNVLLIIADIEAFVNFSKDVQERFANRWRFRAGAGYKINHAFRVEFVYTLQASVNALDGGLSSRENIFRFRLKHYLQKRSSNNPEGTGN